MRSPHRLLAALVLLAACADDEHKGTISHGSAEPSASAGAPARVRLVVRPKSPLASARVAARVKARLSSLDGDARVRIAGEDIHVDVRADEAEAASKALSGGRLDLYLFDERADPFAEPPRDERFGVATETVAGEDKRPVTVRFLTAKPEDRAALVSLLRERNPGAEPLVGPLYGEPRVRSYYVQAANSRQLRGEQLASAKAARSGDRVELQLSFDGTGKSFVHFASSKHSRFVVRVNGEVIGTVQPDQTVTTGTLSLPLASRGDTAATLEAAQELAAELDGVALSHQVELSSQKAP